MNTRADLNSTDGTGHPNVGGETTDSSGPNLQATLAQFNDLLAKMLDVLERMHLAQTHPTLEQARAARLAADPWMSLEEGAVYANRHPQTIRQAALQRELEHARTGPRGTIKLRQSALDRWLRKQTVKPSRTA